MHHKIFMALLYWVRFEHFPLRFFTTDATWNLKAIRLCAEEEKLAIKTSNIEIAIAKR